MYFKFIVRNSSAATFPYLGHPLPNMSLLVKSPPRKTYLRRSPPKSLFITSAELVIEIYRAFV